MKKLFILIGVIGFTSLSACKKGDEDPALSLLTRKTRLTGVWNLSSFTGVFTNDTYGGQTTTVTSDGKEEKSLTLYTSTSLPYDSTVRTTQIIEDKIEFNKDGNWEQLTKHEVVSILYRPTLVETTIYNFEKITSGSWYFANKTNNEYKKKERLVLETLNSFEETSGLTVETDYVDENMTDEFETFETTSREYVYPHGSKVSTLNLLRLANKEMKWFSEGKSEYTFVNGQSESYGDSEFESESTWVKQ